MSTMTNSEELSASEGISSIKSSETFGSAPKQNGFSNGDLKNGFLSSHTSSNVCGSVSASQIPTSQVPLTSGTTADQDYATQPSLPFTLICGEEVTHQAQTSDGVLVLSNYRLFLHSKDATYNLPWGLIESVECRDIFYLHISCKDARYIRCTFSNNEGAVDMLKRIQTAILPSKNLQDNFAFTFYEKSSGSREEVKAQLGLDYNSLPEFPTLKERFDAEVKRMEFNVDADGPWRVSDENIDYELCSSYPPHIIIPYTLDKEKLEKVAAFRSSRRFPAVVWRHKGNGAVISRCSQPEVGLFGWRGFADEELVQNIVMACAESNRYLTDTNPEKSVKARNLSGSSTSDISDSMSLSPPTGAYGSLSSLEVVPDPPNTKKLLILDARSYSTAIVNRARGGGCENLEYYTNCEIQFMNLANIHSIRKSFLNVRQLCSLPPDQANSNWFSQLESCKWLQHMSGLMKAAVTVVTAIEVEGRPVMVHCSDGWDRTPQIVALAEILLDPYYRSLEGFQVLVEREWLDFGHKFADRCGQNIGSDDTNERCPVFLQWLDCLHQLIIQFPSAFEFNLTFLVKLAQHTYSNLFGTFLCNTLKDRETHKINEKTLSIWRFLRSPANFDKFRNNLYLNCDKVLWPSCEIKELTLWTQVYLGYDNPSSFLGEVINPSHDSSPALSVTAECESSEVLKFDKDFENSKARSSSCENLHTFPVEAMRRRKSFPRLSDSSSELDALEHDTPCVISSDTKNDRGDNRSLESIDDRRNLLMNNNCIQLEGMKMSKSESSVKSESFVVNNVKSIESSTDTLVADISVTQNSITESSDLNHEVNLKTENLEKQNIVPKTDAINIPSSNRSENGQYSSAGELIHEELHINGEIATGHRCKVCESSKKVLGTSRTEENPSNDSKFLRSTTPLNYKGQLTNTNGSMPDELLLHGNGKLMGNDRIPEIPRVPASFDVDGIKPLHDEVQSRVNSIVSTMQGYIFSLEKQLQTTREALMQQLGHNCVKHRGVDRQEDAMSDDSHYSGDHYSISHDSHSSDFSFEAVDEKDTRPPLWVPDYAISRCMGCDSTFWLGKRKHHCRSCGKIFCYECSEHTISIPCQQIFTPVRVCSGCYHRLNNLKHCLQVNGTSNTNSSCMYTSKDSDSEISALSKEDQTLPSASVVNSKEECSNGRIVQQVSAESKADVRLCNGTKSQRRALQSSLEQGVKASENPISNGQNLNHS